MKAREGLVALAMFMMVGDAANAALFDDRYRAVIPANDVKDFLAARGCTYFPKGLDRVSAGWLPDAAIIAAAEDRLPRALQRAIQDAPWIGPISKAKQTDWEEVANHSRQYAGIVLNGRKLVLVVAARIYVVDFDGRHDWVKIDNPDWWRAPQGVCDGGSTQFVTFYDPAEGSYRDFTFAGTIAGYSEP